MERNLKNALFCRERDKNGNKLQCTKYVKRLFLEILVLVNSTRRDFLKTLCRNILDNC
jgi:hypothetical protein